MQCVRAVSLLTRFFRHQAQQACVHGTHTLCRTRLNGGIDLVRLCLTDQVLMAGFVYMISNAGVCLPSSVGTSCWLMTA